MAGALIPADPTRPRLVTRPLSGWGRFPRLQGWCARPERSEDLAGVLDTPGSVLARGLGRSYGDAAANTRGRTVLTERLNRMLAFDEHAQTVDVESGVTIADLLATFVPRGLVPPVVPGTAFVSVGGALACDIHGKNHHYDGSFSRHVRQFRLLTASGEILTCDRTNRPDAFWATAGGMGLTGIVTEVRLQLRPSPSAYVMVDYHRARDIETILDRLDATDQGYRYSVAWVDCLSARGRGVMMQANPALPDDGDGPVSGRPPRRIPFPVHWGLHRWSMRAFNLAYYATHPTRATAVRTQLSPFFFPLDGVSGWNRFYGRRGFVQYQVVVPIVGGREAIPDLLIELRRAPGGAFLGVLKRFGPGETEHLLSFPIAGYTLAVDLPYRGVATERFLDRLDAMVVAVGGRVYLAKDARIAPATLRQMYPRLDEWRAVRDRLDPDRRFQSDLGRRLEL